jgi:hypothetical protein
VTGPEWAQVGSAFFTAVAALAALRTVKHADTQNETARATLEASTRPLIAEVPYGLYRKQIEWRTADGKVEPRWEDLSDVNVGTYTSSKGGPEFGASLPIRNVGSGVARIERAEFRVAEGSIEARPFNVLLPPGELTRVGFIVGEGHPDLAVAETIAIEYEDFTATIAYSAAVGESTGTVELRVINGDSPYVRVAH